MSGLKDGVIRRGATWSYVVRVHDPQTGRGRPRWVGGFHTRSEAAAARDEARVAARGGWLANRRHLTLGEYLDQWLDEHAWLIGAATRAQYRRTISTYITPRLGTTPIDELGPDTVTRFYQGLLEHGSRTGGRLAPVTVESVHVVLRKALQDAVWVDQLLLVNPAANAKRPRRPRHVDRDLWTPDQLRVFLSVAAGHRLGPFYRLAAYTGARRGELLALRWSDLHFDRREVTIARSAGRADRVRFEGPTKSGRSRRVALDPGTLTVLRRHRRRQAGEARAAGPRWRGDGALIFTNINGDPLYPSTPSKLMADFAAEAGLPHARLGDLRHLHATLLLTAGVPVHVVAARIGHADPSTTLSIYSHVSRDQATNAARVFATAAAGD